ncbi:MAG: cell division protein SepF [Ilumatobacteraceae bacterium]|jgi:cell division inhibitor SepF|nr:cell division protein SepF [Ilumatobacteraceae bacterium]
MDYLGLGPDDAYDEYDDYEEPEPSQRPRRAPGDPDPRAASRSGYGEPESEGVVRTVPTRPSFPSRDFDPSPARRPVSADDSGVQPRPSRSGLRSVAPVPAMGEPHTVRPVRFDQAQEVADKFKEGQPVIMNLEGTEREVARRLIDFASGICYALDGSMEKVATGVYLLRPAPPRQSRHDEYDD